MNSAHVTSAKQAEDSANDCVRIFWLANLQKKGVQRFGNPQGLIIITIIVWQANLQKKSEFIIYIIRMLQKKTDFMAQHTISS